MRPLSHAGCLFSVLLAMSIAYGLDPRRFPQQHLSQEWSLEHGLPDSYVQTVLRTRDGYLWLGTQNSGLVRFDGMRFTPVRPHFIPEGRNVSIRALLESQDGTLWIATDGDGLWRRDPDGLFGRLTRADGLPNDHVYALLEDDDGQLWFSVGGNGLLRWKDGVLTTSPPLHGPRGLATIYAIFRDRSSNLWLAGEGLWRLEDGHWENYRQKLDLPDDRFFSLAQDFEGRLWLATARGLLEVRNGAVRRHTEADGLSDNRVRSLLVDSDGVLWVGSNSGLDRLRDGRFVRCLTREGTPYDLVYAIHGDREGCLWIGSNEGLARLKDDKYTLISTRDGLPQNIIVSAIQAHDESLWFGTWTKGVARWHDGTVTVYGHSEGLPGNRVKALHQDHAGAIWIGTDPAGLSRIWNGRLDTFDREDLFGAQSIVAIESDHEDRLWFGTNDGRLLVHGAGGFELFPDAASLLGERVQALHQGRHSFWIATESALNESKGGLWRPHPYPASLTGKTVRSLYESRQGELWLCAQDSPLFRFRNGTYDSFTTDHGLSLTNYYAVIEDGLDGLWVTCKNGVFVLDRSELDRFDAGQLTALNALDLTRIGGTRNPRFIRFGHPLAARLQDGRLCFPTTKGAALVDPARPVRNSLAPPVVIETVVVNGLTHTPAALHVLPAGTRDLQVHYTGLSLRTPERVRFRYRLEGYDEGWIAAEHRRVAYYQNLPPGRYDFRVVAANEDDVWNETGAMLSFVQEPRFHQTFWFYSLWLAVAVCAGWWAHRLRSAQQQKRFAAVLEERVRVARDLHDTLEQGLVGISMQLNLAVDQFRKFPGVARKHLETARYMLRHSMADARSAILDLRGSDPGPDLRGELLRLTRPWERPGGPSFVVEETGAPHAHSSFTRTALLRIGQEAITNVIKHADARSVRVDLIHEPHRTVLRVADDGCGFDPETATRMEGHFGLLGLRERVDKLGGQLVLQSAPGAGTTIEVSVPRARDSAAAAGSAQSQHDQTAIP
jgi:ligand-binding sensor domain-containing protein/signal transduction histidine kinase